MDRTTEFEQHRQSLFLLAYRILGTRSDAEDVVQDAYLRWLRAADDDIQSPRSYLMTVVSRLSLDALKLARRKREVYTGPWLPEPLIEPVGAQRLEMAESLSIAFLHVLEQLSPTERVAFLLREVFETSYTELARTLETSEDNCRQIVARAKKHVRNGQPRFNVDHDQHSQVLQEFVVACASGNVAQLSKLLREDAVLFSDGGGKVRAALNPIVGAERITRFFMSLGNKGELRGLHAEFTTVNREPAILVFADNTLESVINLELDDSGRIVRIFLLVNPDKLPRIFPGSLQPPTTAP
ncbi:MAG TPA: RNA polymerase sigma-70 factor [Acidobacteriaceae bacterium]|nr:RNA polymerase sigma-70 factor [Acidobacteriaceae bacterium]